MKINGQIFRIRDTKKFLESYMVNTTRVNNESIEPATGIKILLSSVINGFATGFLPQLYLTAYVNSSGSFQFDISAKQLNVLKANRLAYFVAFKVVHVNIGWRSVEYLQPIYRSESFDITTYNTGHRKFYFQELETDPKTDSVSQEEVNEKVRSAKAEIGELKKLEGTITTGKVILKGSGSGATIKFDIALNVATSSNLNIFIKGKVENMDIDLPGPDFITGICKSKREIQKKIDQKIAELMSEINEDTIRKIMNKIASTSGNSNLAGRLMAASGITFSDLSFPVELKNIRVGNVTMPSVVFRIVPKMVIGFPRAIF